MLVNGIALPMGVWEKETAVLSFPNEWLVPGVNVLDFVAGVNPTTIAPDCPGGNFDDFTMRDYELAPGRRQRHAADPPRGADDRHDRLVVVPGRAPRSPRSSATAPAAARYNSALHKEILFEVDARRAGPAGGRGHHRARRRRAHGHGDRGDKTATRTFTVDNTAPVVESSVPAEGQRLTATVALDVRVKDATGVAGTPALTLDGKPVKQGDQIGHGLPAGAHTLAVTATDTLGNTATREVRFTSASIPDVPTGLDSAVSGTNAPSATLSAKVPGEDGVPLTATFTKADVVAPTAGYQGVSATVPTTLDVRHDGWRRRRLAAPARRPHDRHPVQPRRGLPAVRPAADGRAEGADAALGGHDRPRPGRRAAGLGPDPQARGTC